MWRGLPPPSEGSEGSWATATSSASSFEDLGNRGDVQAVRRERI